MSTNMTMTRVAALSVAMLMSSNMMSSNMLSSNAWAADADGAYVSFGVGNSSCSGWATARKADDVRTVQYKEWLLGYLSAYNNWVHKGQNIAAGKDNAALLAWIDTYCGEHGADPLVQAVESLMLDLKGVKPGGGDGAKSESTKPEGGRAPSS